MREPIAGFTTVSRVIRKYENARTLGSGLSIAYDNERPDPKVPVTPKSLPKSLLTPKSLTGGVAYFGIAEVLSLLREIDKWVRRRLRCYAWKQWGSAGYRDTSGNAGSLCARLGTQARARMAHGG